MNDELSGNTDQPKELSPEDRNRRLREFYLQSYQYLSQPQLPEHKPLEIEDPLATAMAHIETANEIKRKANSEITDTLVKRLSGMLDSANITQPMKDYIAFHFRAILDSGNLPEPENQIPEWVDTNDESGIYDDDRQKVKLIEQSVHQRLVANNTKYHDEHDALLDRLKKSHEQISGPGTWNPPKDPIEDILSRWPGEYKNFYNEELRTS